MLDKIWSNSYIKRKFAFISEVASLVSFSSNTKDISTYVAFWTARIVILILELNGWARF